MEGEKDIRELLKKLDPELNNGEYVFVSIKNSTNIPKTSVICEFKEKEGISVVLDKNTADKLNLCYEYVAGWITLNVHSSLSAVGLTAIIATELMRNDIGCNVIAGYYHDHLFIERNQSGKAMEALKELSENYG